MAQKYVDYQGIFVPVVTQSKLLVATLLEHSLRYNKMDSWALCLLLVIFANNAISQKTLSYRDQSFVYTLTLDSSLSADRVNTACRVKTISIQRRKDGKTIQKIYPQENSAGCAFPADEIFVVEDVNFDEYNDIRLLQFVPASPNLPYYYWVYNSQAGRFQKQRELEEITSPQFEKKKKLIYSFWRSSGYQHGTSTYKYIKDKPVLIEVAEDKEEDGKITTTLKRRVNGKMKLISKTVGKAE